MQIQIDPHEVFRYTASGPLAKSPDWQQQAKKAIAQTEAHMRPRYCYRFFSFKIEKEGVSLPEACLFLPGEDIKKHLSQSKKCVLLAATLGGDVEQLIRRKMVTNMTEGLFLDACADAAIEAVCDSVCEEIQKGLSSCECLTKRYSPGYGDLSLDIQSDFLKSLDAPKQIGLFVSENKLLTPRKSVTAIIGIVEKEESQQEDSCAGCAMRHDCIYRSCRKEVEK